MQCVLKSVPVYTKKYTMCITKVDMYLQKKYNFTMVLGWNELRAESGHATMSAMSCMFDLDM